MARVRLETSQWRAVAAAATEAFIAARGGAVVWPEVEAALSTGSWAADHADLWFNDALHPPEAARVARIDAHHLTYGRRTLLDAAILEQDSAVLNGRVVTAWIHTPTREAAQATLVDRAAAHRRRLYRSFLGWTSAALCGDIAERVVHATLVNLNGKEIWLDAQPRGRIATLDGAAVPGGPLDHAGHIAKDPRNPRAGWIPFAVEVKNVRSWIYPENNEVWDLLAKLGHFPDRVPVLVTRRIHYWTYQLFVEIGAVGHQTQSQWFSPSIEADEFKRVTAELGLFDARQVREPDEPNASINGFLTKTLRSPAKAGNDRRPLIERSAERWQRAAPICAKYTALRDDQLPPEERTAVFEQFVEDLANEGFETSGFSQL